MKPSQTGLWRVVYIARGAQQAEKIDRLLQAAGFLVNRRHFADGAARTEDIEIRVLESEAEEARMHLMEHGY